MTKQVLFRADGSAKLGWGHVVRCLALAEELKKSGVSCLMAMRNCDEKISQLAERSGTKLVSMEEVESPSVKVVVTDLSQRQTWADWPGYKRYLKALKRAGKIVVMIDSFGGEALSRRIKLPLDLLVVPYWRAEKLKYKIDDESRLLAGTKYVILRQEFVGAASKKRRVRKKAKNILVVLGGGKVAEVKLKIARALSKIQIDRLRLKFILGITDQKSTRRTIEQALRKFKGEYELMGITKTMAKLMAWADVAIISNGIVKYELAAVGTPGLALSINKFKERLLSQFEKTGSLIHLGRADKLPENKIRVEVERLLENEAQRQSMAKLGQRLVDGRGAMRIAGKIKAYLEA